MAKKVVFTGKCSCTDIDAGGDATENVKLNAGFLKIVPNFIMDLVISLALGVVGVVVGEGGIKLSGKCNKCGDPIDVKVTWE